MTMTTTKEGKVQLMLGGTDRAVINWSDGTPNDTVTLSIDNNTTLTHSYTGSVENTITITGDNVTFLRCTYNQLTALDVSKNTALTNLRCSNNQLTALDVSNNTSLVWFFIQFNAFETGGLDTLFGTLHNNRVDSPYNYIYVSNNPGTAGCNPGLAPSRWVVDTTH